jgi:hypothetical protein
MADITLWDGGYGPSLEGWRSIRDQILSAQGVSLKPGIIEFADRNIFNFSDASRCSGTPRAGCSVHVSLSRIDRALCRLLFDLAERARLFILIVDEPVFLRPPSLHGADLDRGSVAISDLDSAEALLPYLVPAKGKV